MAGSDGKQTGILGRLRSKRGSRRQRVLRRRASEARPGAMWSEARRRASARIAVAQAGLRASPSSGRWAVRVSRAERHRCFARNERAARLT